MHQSILAAPSPPPLRPLTRADPGWSPGISIFFALDAKNVGGDFEAVKSPGAGTKKEGKCPVLRQRCNIFHWSNSRVVPF